jgi:FMN phosphatase YigB (HAD superfamily)
MKPSPEYYRRAVEMFGIDPVASVFIDDIQENVDAAARSGMIGILFHSREQLLTELHKMGVYRPGYSR